MRLDRGIKGGTIPLQNKFIINTKYPDTDEANLLTLLSYINSLDYPEIVLLNTDLVDSYGKLIVPSIQFLKNSVKVYLLPTTVYEPSQFVTEFLNGFDNVELLTDISELKDEIKTFCFVDSDGYIYSDLGKTEKIGIIDYDQIRTK